MNWWSRFCLWFFGPEKVYTPDPWDSATTVNGTPELPVQRAEFSEFDDDTWIRVALKKVYGRFSTTPSWAGGTVEQCEQALANIKRAYEEFENLEPAKLRYHVMHWLDHYQERAEKDLHDCQTRIGRKEMDAYYEKLRQEQEKDQQLKEALRKAGYQ